MILHVLSGQVGPSIGNEVTDAVVEWSKKLIGLCRKKWPDIDFQFLTMARGKSGFVQWTGKYESFATWEEFFKKVFWQDPDIKALHEEGEKTQKRLGGPWITGYDNSFFHIHEPE